MGHHNTSLCDELSLYDVSLAVVMPLKLIWRPPQRFLE